MFSIRSVEFNDDEGRRWSRMIGGALFVFDLVHTFTTTRGEIVRGRLMVDRYDEIMGEWTTVHYIPV